MPPSRFHVSGRRVQCSLKPTWLLALFLVISRLIELSESRTCANPCAPDEYQHNLLVVNCNGGTCSATVEIQKGHLEQVATLPAGVANVEVKMEAPSSDMDLKLLQGSTCVAGASCTGSGRPAEAVSGCPRNTDYCLQVNGSSWYFSGDKQAPPVTEEIKLSGKATVPFEVFVDAPTRGRATVQLYNDPMNVCPDMLPGCVDCSAYRGCGPGEKPLCDGSRRVDCLPPTSTTTSTTTRSTTSTTSSTTTTKTRTTTSLTFTKTSITSTSTSSTTSITSTSTTITTTSLTTSLTTTSTTFTTTTITSTSTSSTTSITSTSTTITTTSLTTSLTTTSATVTTTSLTTSTTSSSKTSTTTSLTSSITTSSTFTVTFSTTSSTATTITTTCSTVTQTTTSSSGTGTTFTDTRTSSTDTRSTDTSTGSTSTASVTTSVTTTSTSSTTSATTLTTSTTTTLSTSSTQTASTTTDTRTFTSSTKSTSHTSSSSLSTTTQSQTTKTKTTTSYTQTKTTRTATTSKTTVTRTISSSTTSSSTMTETQTTSTSSSITQTATTITSTSTSSTTSTSVTHTQTRTTSTFTSSSTATVTTSKTVTATSTSTMSTTTTSTITTSTTTTVTSTTSSSTTTTCGCCSFCQATDQLAILSRTWSNQKIQLESNVTALQLALTSVRMPLAVSLSQSSDPPSSHGGNSDGCVAAIIILALLTSILGLLLFALVRVALKAKTQLNALRFELGQAEKKLEHLGSERCDEKFHSEGLKPGVSSAHVEIVFDEPPLPQKPEHTSWSKLSEQNADLEEQLMKFGTKNRDLSARLDESKNLLRETRLILRQRTLQLGEHKALLAEESMDRQQAAHKEARDASKIANLREQLAEKHVQSEQLTKERDSALAKLEERCHREGKTDTMPAAVESVLPSVDADLSERTTILETKFASVQMAAKACLARRASRLTLLSPKASESSFLDLRSWKSPSAASLGGPLDRRRLFQNLVRLNVSPTKRDLSIISEVSSKQSASTRASSLPPGQELRNVATAAFPGKSNPSHSLFRTQQLADVAANIHEAELPFLAAASFATPERTTLTEVHGYT